jgi:hypothetical protein
MPRGEASGQPSAFSIAQRTSMDLVQSEQFAY